MHETLFSTKAKSDQPYISTLVLFKDHTVPTLDAITRNIVIPHIDAEPLGSEGNDRLSMEKFDEEKFGGRDIEDETFGGDDHKGPLASNRDESRLMTWETTTIMSRTMTTMVKATVSILAEGI